MEGCGRPPDGRPERGGRPHLGEIWERGWLLAACQEAPGIRASATLPPQKPLFSQARSSLPAC